MKKRVLLVTKLYHPWIGGIERHVQDIAEALKDRFEIRVLCCQEPGERDEKRETKSDFQLINGIPVYKTPSLGIYFSMPLAPSFPFWLRRLSKDADIIHFHLPFPLAVFSHWFLSFSPHHPLSPSPRHLVTWHSDVVRQKTLDKALSPWTNWFLNRADAVIATSKSLVRSSPYLRAYEKKCRVIPLSINPEVFELTEKKRQAAEAIRRKHQGATLALFVGRLVPYKGARYLLEALSQTKQNIKVLMAGGGPLEPEMRELAGRLNLNGRVDFLGSVDGEALISLFHACDYFVLPSITNNEAFGIVQMEAMACGKPVINTGLPTGVPEVSLHEETGLTVHPRDSHDLAAAMDRLSGDAALRLKLGQNARLRVLQEYSIQKVADQIAALYK